MDNPPPFDEEPQPEETPKATPEKPAYSIHNLPELTDEQKAYLEAHWEDNHADLAKAVSGDPSQDGRSFWGIAVKRYLAGLGKVVKTSKKVVKGPLELTDEQKAFIDANHKQMAAREMMNLLFADRGKLTTLGAEFRAIWAYVKSLNADETDIFDEPVESQEYKAPTTLGSLIGRVNQFITNPKDHTKARFDPGKLKPQEDKNLRALIGYMRTPRFRNQASQYKKIIDRTLFESTFIRFVYDKASEITEGEVDLYIAAATKTIAITRLERSIEGLQDKVDSALAGEDDKDGNKSKLSMTLVELINESHTKVNQYAGQLQNLIESLEGERSKRVAGRNTKNSSLLTLFDAVHEADQREGLLKLGEQEKEEDGDVIKKIKSMADVLGMVAGVTENEGQFG